jgi:hypothetical protein
MNYSATTRLAYQDLFREAEAGLSGKMAAQLAQVVLRHPSAAALVREGR